MSLLSYHTRGLLEAGCDEAGRGCIAGPVCAAAVILPSDFFHPLLNDSKKLSEKTRYELRPIIEANAIDYLLKPFSKERFDLAIQKWNEKKNTTSSDKNILALLENTTKQPDEKSRIVVKNGSDIRIVPMADVMYIEAYDDYVKIFTKDTYFLKKKTMKYYEQVLDSSQFFRTHRSFIINLQELTKIEPLEKNTYVVLLKNGKRIPLSRTGYSKLKETLGV